MYLPLAISGWLCYVNDAMRFFRRFAMLSTAWFTSHMAAIAQPSTPSTLVLVNGRKTGTQKLYPP